MNQAEAYCHRNAPTPQISDLYADIYNMRGNVLARQALVDSAVICFSKALNYRLNGDRKEVLPDISINLADAYVRTGQYDKGALWYGNPCLFLTLWALPKPNVFRHTTDWHKYIWNCATSNYAIIITTWLPNGIAK